MIFNFLLYLKITIMKIKFIFPLALTASIILLSSCSETLVELNKKEFLVHQLKIVVEKAETLINDQVAGNPQNVLRVSPRSLTEAGELNMVASRDWTSGFFPGNLWFMYEWTGDDFFLEKAKTFTSMIEQEKFNGTTHDMGFKIFCSFGNGYRLTENEHYREVLIHAANTLVTRFSETVGCLRSWDHNDDKWDYPVIIDNMMNLELLFWATQATGDSVYYDIAVKHATRTMQEHFRPDGSSYHVIDFNPETGEVQARHTHQGYAHESAWARGQAWGLYGFTMAYRETGIKNFLDKARIIASFMLEHPNLPTDLIPYWDFDAPGIPGEPRDVSAATITASALYELSTLDKENGKRYSKAADTIIENLERGYLSPKGENYGFILTQSTGHKPHGYEIAVPIIYADYYYIEALLRKESLTNNTL
jgi:unsaturated chondroitin disaccharide hydrolase